MPEWAIALIVLYALPAVSGVVFGLCMAAEMEFDDGHHAAMWFGGCVIWPLILLPFLIRGAWAAFLLSCKGGQHD